LRISIHGNYQHLILNSASALESLNPIITSLVQLVNSHRSASEASDVRRLTYIAIVFIPLSFVATIFSMGDDFLPGKGNFWLYWATSIPITLAVLAATCLHLVKPYYLRLSENLRGLLRRERDNESISSG
jgi:Mg2+ and Co2+ transporter CorA